MPRIVLAAAPLRDGPTALRPWRDSDLAALVEACQDPEIPRWTRVPSPYGPADARLYLQQRHDGLHAGVSGASKSAGSRPPCSPMRSASHRRS